MAPTFQFPVQVIEQDVGHQRRERRTLRGSQLAWLDGIADHHAGPQVSANQCQQPRIANPSSHSGYQEIVLGVVEELRQVQIDGNAVARLDMGLYLPERSMSTALGSKAEARLGELRIEDRRHDLRDGLLDQPIDYARNTQQSLEIGRASCRERG